MYSNDHSTITRCNRPQVDSQILFGRVRQTPLATSSCTQGVGTAPGKSGGEDCSVQPLVRKKRKTVFAGREGFYCGSFSIESSPATPPLSGSVMLLSPIQDVKPGGLPPRSERLHRLSVSEFPRL